jgi:hypothetical protein
LQQKTQANAIFKDEYFKIVAKQRKNARLADANINIFFGT